MRPVALLAVTLLVAACGSETERVVARTSAPPAATAAARTSPAATTASTTTAPPTAVRTASATPPASPRPSATQSASLPPMPSLPAIPSGARAVADGTVQFTIDAGATRQFDPAALATGRGQTAPPCAQTVWTAAWRATEPLVAAWIRQTARTELGRGRWGTAELGCAVLELRNDGSASVTGELGFAIASR